MGYGLVFGCAGYTHCGCGFHRKIRLTQLWVELSWVVAISLTAYTSRFGMNMDFWGWGQRLGEGHGGGGGGGGGAR